MSYDPPTSRPSGGTRRAGYAVAVVVNAVVLYLVNVRPGWQAVPFLTDETTSILQLVNISIIANLGANVLYLVFDPMWFRALGEAATTAISLYVLVRLWQVFPFDFGGPDSNWVLLAQILLIAGIIGSAIGILVQLVSVGRHLATRH